MYSAYQSGQSGSGLPIRASCSPCAAAARCIAVRQVGGGGKRRLVGVDPSGQPRRNLLEQPAVAVRVAERGERAVTAPIGRRSGYTVGVVESIAQRSFVEDLAHVHTARQ